MRISPLSLAAVALVTASTSALAEKFDDILALHGSALFEAAENIPAEELSPRDIIRITQALAAERKNFVEGKHQNFALSTFFEAACKRADTAELDKLIEIYVNFDPSSFEKEFLLQPLLALWLKREVTTDQSKPVAHEPQKNLRLPSKLKNLQPELAEAWLTYKANVRPVEQTIYSPAVKARISFQANERRFFGTINDVLLEKGKGHAEELARFGWSGLSGTGSELLYEPRSIGILMALLTEHRIAEALGAALYLQCDKLLLNSDSDLRSELLRHYGADWEAVLAGAQIDWEVGDPAGGWNPTYLHELAAFGSDHAATLVGMMARNASAERRIPYAHAISTFFKSGPEKEVRFSFGADERISKAPISRQKQQELIAILEDYVKGDASVDLAKAALDGFARAKLPSSKPTLYALTKHSSTDVVQAASTVLQSMGEEVAVSAPEPPVRFRIFVNRELLPTGVWIQWEVGGTSSSEETLGLYPSIWTRSR
jgi:hypothetical protein